jgi:hypothetical protein
MLLIRLYPNAVFKLRVDPAREPPANALGVGCKVDCCGDMCQSLFFRP